jgi:hypothetical protein
MQQLLLVTERYSDLQPFHPSTSPDPKLHILLSRRMLCAADPQPAARPAGTWWCLSPSLRLHTDVLGAQGPRSTTAIIALYVRSGSWVLPSAWHTAAV